jgi:hypothetical protein
MHKLERERHVLRRVRLKPENKPRGNVNYFVDGEPIPPPAALEIVLAGGSACHLIYLAKDQAELAESWHPTLDAALYHAKWEYGVDPAAWENLTPGARM